MANDCRTSLEHTGTETADFGLTLTFTMEIHETCAAPSLTLKLTYLIHIKLLMRI